MADPFYIRRIRTGVVTRSEFFGMCLGNLKVVPDEAVETAETDGIHLWYNPAYVESLYENDFEEACGLFAHEAFHASANHPLRVGDRDEYTANIAADYVTNGEVKRAGFKLPKGAYYDPKYDGLSFERVFNMIEPQQRPEKPQQKGPGQGEGEGDGESGEGASSGPQGDAGQDGQQPGQDGQQAAGNQPGQGDGQGNGQDGDQDGQGAGQGDGNGSGRPPGPSFDVGGCGSFRRPRQADGTLLTPIEQSKLKTQWEIVTEHARMVAERIGNAPGAATQLVHDMQAGQTDWVEETRRFFRKLADSRYTWLRSDRRIPPPLYIPSRTTPQMGEIVIIGDTSGSVSERQWVIIASEMRSLVKEINPKRLHVVFNDAVIQETREYEQTDYDDIDFTRKGFGGTKVQPAFNWIEEQGLNPACVLFFTDLEIDDFPEQEPDYPVLWCSVNKPFAPWGDIVMLDEI